MTVSKETRNILAWIGGIVAAAAFVAGVVTLTVKFLQKKKKCDDNYIDILEDEDDIVAIYDQESEQDSDTPEVQE